MSPSVQQQVPSKPSVWLVAGCLLAVYVIWGTTYFAIKVGIEGAPPFFLVGTRFVVAGALLLGWQALRGRPMPAAKQWRGAAISTNPTVDEESRKILFGQTARTIDKT